MAQLVQHVPRHSCPGFSCQSGQLFACLPLFSDFLFVCSLLNKDPNFTLTYFKFKSCSDRNIMLSFNNFVKFRDNVMTSRSMDRVIHNLWAKWIQTYECILRQHSFLLWHYWKINRNIKKRNCEPPPVWFILYNFQMAECTTFICSNN